MKAPQWLAEHAEAFRASGAVPAEPRLAATVVLLRPAPSGFEVYVQRRAATMAFAPGMYAFPGGSVDPADYSTYLDIPLDESLGLPVDSARAVRHAAVRELDEEAGVRITADQLVPWARWITPEFEPRRFDTFFFLAPMPAGQHARGETDESDHAVWLAPADALRLAMLPPTRRTIGELARFSAVEAALAAGSGRDLKPVQPVIEVDKDGAWLRLFSPD